MHRIFQALGDPTRRQVLELLAAGEQPAGAVVARLQERAPISQPAVSQHLKVLREAGLVTVRTEGTRRLYAINADGIGTAQAQTPRTAESATPTPAWACPCGRGERLEGLPR